MNTNIKRLLASLEQLIAFFQKVPRGTNWIDILSDIRSKLSSVQTRDEGLALLDRYFRGMGTLNDVFFARDNHNIPVGYSEKQANREFERLLDVVFKDYKLLNGTYLDRIWWEFLRFKHRRNLPPRVINAFARKSTRAT
jgi:hypothetical protein